METLYVSTILSREILRSDFVFSVKKYGLQDVTSAQEEGLWRKAIELY